MFKTASARQQEVSWNECMRLLEGIPSMSLEDRTETVKKLLRNPSPSIRQRALSIGAAILSEEQLTSYIRNESDDIIRNAGLEILKLKGAQSFSVALGLLRDSEPDVVLQAILILDHIKDPRAFNSLRTLLRHENPNVVQEAITAIGHLGDGRAIPDLLPFLKADSWLQMAAIKALGDIRSTVAVYPLAELLTDLMVGSLAAEALSRIGGTTAYRALSKHWLKFSEQLDAETTLGLLAHVIEGIAKNAPAIAGLRQSLSMCLDDPSEAVRVSAASCLLALGPGPEDDKAIAILETLNSDLQDLPACLRWRSDLIPIFLKAPARQRTWGFQLVAHFPKAISVQVLSAAVSELEIPADLDCVVKALAKIKNPEIFPVILDLYLRTPVASRPLLSPLLRINKKRMRTLLLSPFVDNETRLVISALLGVSTNCISYEILKLPKDSRIRVISQITDQKAILKRFPWVQWLENEPSFYADIAAEVAIKSNLRELIPSLRKTLAFSLIPRVISAIGEMGDRASVPILVTHLNQANSFIRALIIENLGRIGGIEARKALRETIRNREGKESSLAYRALSRCAVEEDVQIFFKAVTHPDWIVRLACAEVLGRFPKAENLDALTKLAADPVPVVAQQAMAFMDM